MGSVKITPITNCGPGQSVEWTINANQDKNCGSFDDGGWLAPSNQGQINTTVFPNPFSYELNI